MILADSSVWIDHLRASDRALATLLDARRVLCHPFVIGEIALGHLRQRDTSLRALSRLPQAPVVTEREALAFIHAFKLFGRGIGYVDVHLLAAVRLVPEARLWTRDQKLRRVAEDIGLAHD